MSWYIDDYIFRMQKIELNQRTVITDLFTYLRSLPLCPFYRMFFSDYGVDAKLLNESKLPNVLNRKITIRMGIEPSI